MEPQQHLIRRVWAKKSPKCDLVTVDTVLSLAETLACVSELFSRKRTQDSGEAGETDCQPELTEGVSIDLGKGAQREADAVLGAGEADVAQELERIRSSSVEYMLEER